MSLNCNEIDLILSELSLEGSLIQDVIQPGYDTLALRVYGSGKAGTVLVCTAQNVCRINGTRRKITKNARPLRFMEFLKANILGARIDSCRQIGCQRVIEMKLLRGGRTLFLYIRLWSNAANVIVCESDGTILDAMYRRPKRGEVTGGKFRPPAPDSGRPRDDFPVRDFSELQEECGSACPGGRPLSFNEKVDLWYGSRAAVLSEDALRLQAEKQYAAQKNRMEAALEKLQSKLSEFGRAGQYRKQGDLILSFWHTADGKPEFLECDDYESGERVRIAVDPEKSAHENAAVYYEKYRKAKSGAARLARDIEAARRRLEILDARYREIRDERNPVRIEQLLRGQTASRRLKKRTHPGLDYTADGWDFLVGRDADENDGLLRHCVRGCDLWLHTRDFPGGYVFIRNRPGKTVPRDILLDAANLAVHYSKARGAKKADLYCTHVKYLRRVKNGKKGAVIPTHEKNICIEPDGERLARLDAIRQEAGL